MDRISDFGSEGWGFESSLGHKTKKVGANQPAILNRNNFIVLRIILLMMLPSYYPQNELKYHKILFLCI